MPLFSETSLTDILATFTKKNHIFFVGQVKVCVGQVNFDLTRPMGQVVSKVNVWPCPHLSILVFLF